ncbi:MAG TPA: pseudouridine synthase [Bacteroidota bacterium]|jgi:pseudouridine synthase
MMRLNKYLSAAGIVSRRKADQMITEGRVSVNGTVATVLGLKIDPGKDQVFADGKQVLILDEPVYVVLNKPRDCITTMSDERDRPTVLKYVRTKERVFPVGRLDRNTTGVLILTNDGEFANALMHPKNLVDKAYKVTLTEPVKPEHIRRLAEGIRLSEGKTAPAELHVLPKSKNMVVGIIIHEGKNRQVHRMFEALGYQIEKLDRVGYGGITYEGLKRGEWRYLRKSEVRRIQESAGIKETLTV